MSALPKAVQAQLDHAEAIQAQLSAESAPVTGNPEPEATYEQPGEAVTSSEVQETQVTQQAPSVDWEQKFRVIEGKYRAELPRLLEQNRELSDRLDQAIKAMETKPEPTPQDSKLVTDADVEAYGSDLVDMVRRASREEFDALSKKLVAELDKRFGQVTEQVAKTQERVVKSDTDKFWDEVYKAHADFDAVNADDRWFAFLDARIPGTRLTRRATAEQALNTLDSASIGELLSLFKESIAPAQGVVKPKPKQNLNAQVAPSSSKASTPPDTQSGRIMSGAEYAAALDHRNLQRMSREEYEAQVADAELALAEGRVNF